MKGFWVITKKTRNMTFNNTLCHKQWRGNAVKGTEAIKLLELLHVFKIKGKNIETRKVVVGVNNSKSH